jgi:sugar lactone lactonase YvrE
MGLGIFAVWLGCAPLSRAVDTFYVSVYNQYGSGGENAILKVTDVGGTPVVTTFASGFTQPEGIAFDASGNLYVVDISTIYKYSPDGVQSVFASDPVRINGQPTTGLFVDSHGNVWVPGDGRSSYASIIEYDPSGVEIKTVVTYGGPSGFVVDAAGNLYVANSFNGDIVKYAPDGSSTTLVTDDNLYSAAGLVFTPDGSLLVACGRKIYEVQDGVLVLYATLSATGGGMVFDSDGNLLTALEGGGSKNGIAITTPDGTTSTYLSLNKYEFPNTLAIAPATIPEPGTRLLLLSGLLALALCCVRLKRDSRRVILARNHERLR